MARFVVRNAHQKDMCCNDIKLCVLNVHTILQNRDDMWSFQKIENLRFYLLQLVYPSSDS
jgi:hypothetical protein